MPANKNALIRYKTIDNCLRNRYRKWTLEDLVDACCQALYEMEGLSKGVSVRTVQNDIQMMRSDKLGYNAPIEVYDHKYYRYADEDYSITHMPFSNNEFEMMKEAVDMLREKMDWSDDIDYLLKEGVIQRFEYTHELAWKVMKDYAEYQGYTDLRGSRDSFRTALQMRLIEDAEWLDSIEDRNLTSHNYDDEMAEEIYTAIIDVYYPLMVKFERKMVEIKQTM